MPFVAGSTKSLANVHHKYNLTAFALVTILVLRALEVPTRFRDCHHWKGVSDYRSKGFVIVFYDVFPGFCNFLKAHVFFKVNHV